MSFSRHLLPALAISLLLSSTANSFQLFQPKKETNKNTSETVKNATGSMVIKADLSPEAIKALLEIKFPGMKIESVEPSPKEGIYQAFYNGQLLYVSSDGDFLFTGNLLGLSKDSPVNHTEIAMTAKAAELSPQRAKRIASLREEDMVIFKAKDEKYAITVFTDVDCAYCRKLHKEVPQLNANGVTVRYLAFPRAGVGSSAYDKLVSVWCSDDRQLAMNNAKLKREFVSKTCVNPIASQYELTREFGLTGTPALILPDGELLSGYLPFQRLLDHLKSKEEAATAAGK